MAGQGKGAIDMLLAASFKELTLKEPIEKITIKEITDKAGVIRPTFYNHFQDKYDLLEWIINKELLEPVEMLITNGMVNEGLVLLFTEIERDKEFYMRASRLEGQNSFGSIAQDCVEHVLLKVIHSSSAGKKQKYVWLTRRKLRVHYQAIDGRHSGGIIEKAVAAHYTISKMCQHKYTYLQMCIL